VIVVGNSGNKFYIANVSGGDLATFNGIVGLALAPGQQITDLAGNPLPNTAPAINQSYTVDHIPPAAPTVNPLVTNNNKPVLTGTWDEGTPGGAVLLQVTVDGTTFTHTNAHSNGGGGSAGSSSATTSSPQLTSDGAGHWTLTTTAPIPDGFYNVLVHTSDAAGNFADDLATNALMISTSAPVSTVLTGEYAVSTNGSKTHSLASIAPSGNQWLLIGSTVALGTVASPTQLQIGGSTATYGDSRIAFGSAGPFANQVWTKLDLPANYTTARGAATHVTTNGNSIAFVDENGVSSAATWINPTQLFAFGLTATVGNGKLTWSNGTVWYENVSLNGSVNGTGNANISARPSQFTVLDYTNLAGAPVHVIETGTTSVVFVDSLGRMSLGSFFNASQANATLYPGDPATFSGNLVLWHDGSIWIRTAVPSSQITLTDYSNPQGLATHTIRNGTANVVVSDSLGHLSLGTFFNATQALTLLYPDDVVTFAANSVSWQDGTVWTKIGVPAITTTATGANGAVSHLQLLSPVLLVGLDGPLQGVHGTRLNGRIFWSNGEVWTNFNFNALNAFFEMGTGFP
jgi:hypothetical protein